MISSLKLLGEYDFKIQGIFRHGPDRLLGATDA